jgi:hypothetical protein
MIDLDTMPPDWSFAENHAKAVRPGIAEDLHVKTGKASSGNAASSLLKRNPFPFEPIPNSWSF